MSPARAGHSPSPPSLCLAVWNVSIAQLPNALSSARAVHPPPGAGRPAAAQAVSSHRKDCLLEGSVWVGAVGPSFLPGRLVMS